MNIGRIIENSVRVYFKNIVVNLFFSALIMLLPYLQYVLFKNSVNYIACVIFVIIFAFLSVTVVYIPFVVSIRKGHITQLWQKLLLKSLPISLIWAALCTAFFLATYFVINNAENPIGFLIMFIVFAFFLWELVILKCVNIVSNAEKDVPQKNSLLSVLVESKKEFLSISALGIFVLFLIPVLWEIKKTDNLLMHPDIEYKEISNFGKLVLSADEAILFAVFIFIPLFVIMLCESYPNITGKSENDG